MANVANRQNMTIAIKEYTDSQGQTKKVWKTIGEIVTWDDGSQSFELWGAGGYVKGNVFDKQDNQNQQQGQQQQQQGYAQQGYQQQPMQGQQPMNGGYQNQYPNN